MRTLLNRFEPAQARRLAIIIFSAFVLYTLAALAFGQLTDPRAPFDAVAQSHTEIGLLFGIIGYSFDAAFLAVLVGGLPILADAIRSAITQRRKPLLWLLALPLLALPAVIIYNAVIFNSILPGGISDPSKATALQLFLNASAQGLGLLIACASVIALAIVVDRSEISPRLLRFALLPAAVVLLAMTVTLLGVILWSVLLWRDAPQLFSSPALGAAGLSGAVPLVIVGLVMALPLSLAALSLIRNLSQPPAEAA